MQCKSWLLICINTATGKMMMLGSVMSYQGMQCCSWLVICINTAAGKMMMSGSFMNIIQLHPDTSFPQLHCFRCKNVCIIKSSVLDQIHIYLHPDSEVAPIWITNLHLKFGKKMKKVVLYNLFLGKIF